MRDVAAKFHQAMAVSAFAGKLGLTSVDSYHMTVFPGANDQNRTQSGWPSYVPIDESIEACNTAVEERMRSARLRCELPFRVQVDEAATLHYPRACTLRMKALNEREEAKLRSVRDQLAVIYGFRLPDHATYQFHVTLSYQTATFSAAEQKDFDTLRAKYVSDIIAAQPVLELGNPEFCTFPDMFRFEPKLLLSCVG